MPVLTLEEEEESNSPEPRRKNDDSDADYSAVKINSATRKMRRFTDQLNSASNEQDGQQSSPQQVPATLLAASKNDNVLKPGWNLQPT